MRQIAFFLGIFCVFCTVVHAGDQRIILGEKSLDWLPSHPTTERIFTDSQQREVILQGWNVSGATKLHETGFTPFRNTSDAQAAFLALRQATGANVVRFLVSWEGVNPERRI